MIFDLSSSFIKGVSPSLLSDLVAQVVYHYHYLSFPGDLADYVWQAVEKNSSSTQTDLWLQSVESLSPTSEIRAFETTVSDSSYSYDALLFLASRPAIILMENTREWDVYKSMIDAYSSDAIFGNLFKLLKRAADYTSRQCMLPRQTGGCSEIPHCINDISSIEGYGMLSKRKLYVILDRDTSAETAPLGSDKNLIINILCRKTHLTVSENDIYSIAQPEYIWHMWYRRSIENYFPDSVFSAIGRTLKRGMPKFETNYYGKVEDYYAHGHVKKSHLKNDLGNLASHMTRALYDVNLHSFQLGTVTVSELQLFLLKMIRII